MDATLIDQKDLATSEHISILRYSIPAVAQGNNSGMVGVTIPSKSGKLIGIRISCLSTNFDISLFDKADGVTGTLNEFLLVTANNLRYDDQSIISYFANRDNPSVSKIYLLLTNPGIDTGLVTFELIIQNL